MIMVVIDFDNDDLCACALLRKRAFLCAHAPYIPLAMSAKYFRFVNKFSLSSSRQLIN